MPEQMPRTDSIMPNIAAMQMEIQRDKLDLDRESFVLAGKQAKTQKIAAISAVIAAIAAVIAAAAGIINLIVSMSSRSPHT